MNTSIIGVKNEVFTFDLDDCWNTCWNNLTCEAISYNTKELLTKQANVYNCFLYAGKTNEHEPIDDYVTIIRRPMRKKKLNRIVNFKQ